MKVSKINKKIINFFTNTKLWFSNKYKTFFSKPLIKKIFYTLFLILIFRILASITTPGMKVDASKFDDNSIFGVIDLIGGGTLKNFSIVALGISPYIMASIIMQLLQSDVCPPIYRLSKSGPDGKRKINVITRVITLCFAFLQAITISQQNSSLQNFISFDPQLNYPWFQFFVLPIILMSGSLFVLFLAEQITKNGVGNGTSLIIFTGAVVSLPSKFQLSFRYFILNSNHSSIFSGIFNFFIFLLIFFVLIWILTLFYKSERHIPIQQTGAALTKKNDSMSFLPIKVNPAGVMPIIFASMLISIPQLAVQFVDKEDLGRKFVEENFKPTNSIGLAILASLIFFFSMIMALVTFNPIKISEQFEKNATFIPGIKIGTETEDYLTGVVLRLACFSGFFLSIITSISFIQQILGVPSQITIGGTSLVIIVSVAVETIQQLQARNTSEKIVRAKIKSTTNVNDKNIGGLLW